MVPLEKEASYGVQRLRKAPEDEYPLAEVSLGILLHVKTHAPMPEKALARLALRELRRMAGEVEVRNLKPHVSRGSQTAAPAAVERAPEQARPARRGAGRRPSPATQALREAMEKDALEGQPRSRADYLAILQKAGGPKSDNAAGIIVNREAKRAFGQPLGRAKGTQKRGGGRQASPATEALRAKLQADAAGEGLRDASYYVRWLQDQPGGAIGLKRARPLVYRELASVRKA